MKKSQLALCVLITGTAISLTSCETLIRAFADQMGRNAADALWGKKSYSYSQTKDFSQRQFTARNNFLNIEP